MRIFRSFIVAILMTASADHSVAASPGSEADIAMTIQGSRLVGTAHVPIFVDLAISNRSALPIEIDLGPDRRAAFSLQVSSEGGAAKSYPYPYAGGLARIGWQRIGAGQTLSARLLVNQWHALTVPGKYDLWFVFDGRVKSAELLSNVRLVTSRTELAVLPRDEASLIRKCQELKELAIAAPNSEVATNAALALSFVDDEIAVPYLDEVLRNSKFGKANAASGLASIANRAAVNALIAGLKETGSETADLARSALRRLAMAQLSDELKFAVRRALADS